MSLMAGLATGLGSVPVMIFKDIPHKVYDALLGFAAGIMLSAAAFSLIQPGLENGPVWLVLIGIGVAAVFVYMAELLIPHLHPHFSQEMPGFSMSKALLMALAVTIHNFPEGLAVGVGYASGADKLGVVLALAIAAQNVPEGLAVAAPLRKAGLSRGRSMLMAALSGLPEPIAALFGILALSVSKAILPFALGFAGGAMIYVVSDEVIPECHSHGNEREATFGVIIGFLAMIIIQSIAG